MHSPDATDNENRTLEPTRTTPGPTPTIHPASPAAAIATTAPVTAPELLRSWLGGRSANTQRAYLADMVAFARWYTHTTPTTPTERTTAAGTALTHYLALDPGRANLAARDWLTAMLDAGLAPATIHRRLATLSSFVRFGRMIGAITWTIDIDRPRTRPYRDTTGPGLATAGRMAAVLTERPDTPTTRRDRAIFLLAATAGLRRGEIAALRTTDLDLAANRIRILGKGSRERTWHPVDATTSHALAAWLDVRDDTTPDAPVFVGITRHGRQRTTPLTTDGIYRMIRALGTEAGATTPVRPHGLRHTAITTVAEREGIAVAQRLSRHRKLDTLQLYLDNADTGHTGVEGLGAALDHARRAATNHTATP